MPEGDKVIDLAYIRSLKKHHKAIDAEKRCPGTHEQRQINDSDMETYGICDECKTYVGCGPGQAKDYINDHERPDTD